MLIPVERALSTRTIILQYRHGSTYNTVPGERHGLPSVETPNYSLLCSPGAESRTSAPPEISTSDLRKSARGLLLIILTVQLVPNHGKRCWRTFIDRIASPGKSD